MNKVRLLMAASHTLFRENLALLLASDSRYSVVGHTGSGQELVALARQLRPCVVLLDLSLPEGSGMETIRHLLRVAPRSRVVVLSLHARWAQARRALHQGAHGYLSRSSTCRELKEALEQVMAGGRYICRELGEQRAGHRQEADISALTPREREIIRQLRQGASSREVATRMGIAVRTVETHRYNILRKLQLRSTTALIEFVCVHGL